MLLSKVKYWVYRFQIFIGYDACKKKRFLKHIENFIKENDEFIEKINKRNTQKEV